MKSVRLTLSAIGLVVTMLGMATVPAFAAVAQTCIAKHHDCGNTASIATCCCGDAQTSSPDSTPGQSRAEFHPDLFSMLAVTHAVQVATTPHARFTVHTSPPHRHLVDLPTLFSTLLI